MAQRKTRSNVQRPLRRLEPNDKDMLTLDGRLVNVTPIGNPEFVFFYLQIDEKNLSEEIAKRSYLQHLSSKADAYAMCFNEAVHAAAVQYYKLL